MADILHTIYSNAFSCMKINEFHIGFQWSWFLRFKLTIFQNWFRQWLGDDQATSHYLNQWWLVYWRIYASLSLNELSKYNVWTFQVDLLYWILQNHQDSNYNMLKLKHPGIRLHFIPKHTFLICDPNLWQKPYLHSKNNKWTCQVDSLH